MYSRQRSTPRRKESSLVGDVAVAGVRTGGIGSGASVFGAVSRVSHSLQRLSASATRRANSASSRSTATAMLAITIARWNRLSSTSNVSTVMTIAIGDTAVVAAGAATPRACAPNVVSPETNCAAGEARQAGKLKRAVCAQQRAEMRQRCRRVGLGDPLAGGGEAFDMLPAIAENGGGLGCQERIACPARSPPSSDSRRNP